MLPTVVGRFTEEWPSIEILLRESHHDDELSSWVERGDLDLAFVQMPLDTDTLEVTEVLRDAYVLVVRADSPLAGRDRPPSLKEIAGERLIGYRDCRATAIVESQLRASGFEPEFVFRTDDNGVVQGLVAAGVGSAIVPRLAVDEANDAPGLAKSMAGGTGRPPGAGRQRGHGGPRRVRRPAQHAEQSQRAGQRHQPHRPDGQGDATRLRHSARRAWRGQHEPDGRGVDDADDGSR